MVAVTGILLRNNITSEQLNQTLNVLDRAEGSFTGQNLMWSLQILLTRAALASDDSGAASLFQKMWGAVSVQTNRGDGIQPDMSEY